MRVQSVKSAKQHLYQIVFDDGQCGEIDKTVWEHSGVRVGDELSEERWLALLQQSMTDRAREKALYYLSLRDYGSGELVQKLCRCGIERVLAEQTVVRLCECGLINDERYAVMLARNMQERKLYPKRRIAMALREKGFSSEVIELALEELPDEEENQAYALLIKKRLSMPLDSKQREKALGMLARAGFSYTVSSKAITRLETENDDD